jgi:integrase
MGYHCRATAHGFRATASTILNEQGFRPHVIERQLAHVERNKVRAAYHRAEYLPERRKSDAALGGFSRRASIG